MTKDRKSDPQSPGFVTDREQDARLTRSGPPKTGITGVEGQTPGIKGYSALEGVTYVHVSDAQGRMEEDLFEMLCEETGRAR